METIRRNVYGALCELPDRRRSRCLRRGRRPSIRPAAERRPGGQEPGRAVCVRPARARRQDLRRTPLEDRNRELAKLLRKAFWALQLNEHIAEPGDVVFRHACKLGFEGIVSKRLGSPYRSGRSRDWIKTKNPAAPAVKREAEEDWSK